MGQLENYIELMFHISIQQHAMNPVKEGSVYTLPYMINWVRRAKFDNENFQKLFLSGSNCLQAVKSKIIASGKNLQSRSVWLNSLKEEKSVEIKKNTYNYMIEIIEKYFPNLTEEQKKQFEALDALYRDWNSKINVISRKDIDNLYEHHVLHSLAIAKAIHFRPGTEILDFGCGGGFPGIPLAILFPECKFKLIDGTGKKIRVCNEVATAINLQNLKAEHLRGEDEKGKYDFVVSRAVMQLPDLMKIIKKNFKQKGQNALPNGLLCLKGGNLKEELKQYFKISEITPLSTFFDEEWFSQDKQLVYVPA